MAREKIENAQNAEKFAAEYVLSGNLTKAAVAAGYSESTARCIGGKLLRHPMVQDAVKRHRQDVMGGASTTVLEVVSRLVEIMRSDPREVLEVTPYGTVKVLPSELWSPAAAASVASVSKTKDGVTVKMVDKLGAIDKILRHLGAYALDESQSVKMMIVAATPAQLLEAADAKALERKNGKQQECEQLNGRSGNGPDIIYPQGGGHSGDGGGDVASAERGTQSDARSGEGTRRRSRGGAGKGLGLGVGW